MSQESVGGQGETPAPIRPKNAPMPAWEKILEDRANRIANGGLVMPEEDALGTPEDVSPTQPESEPTATIEELSEAVARLEQSADRARELVKNAEERLERTLIALGDAKTELTIAKLAINH